MCTADAARARGDAFERNAFEHDAFEPDAFEPDAFNGGAFTSATDALRTAAAALDCLNGACADLDGTACGELLPAVGEVRAKLAAAEAGLLRRFDAAGAHDADGYGSSSAWLAARAGMTGKAARAAVRQMRLLGERPLLGAALAAGAVTESLALAIADWTRTLPPPMRAETDRILLDAAAAGASHDDLAAIAGCAIEQWRQQQPDPDNPDDGFDDRSLRLGTTFGGAAVIRGDLTPECAAAVRAVLEALGKKQGRRMTAPRASGSTTPSSRPVHRCPALADGLPGLSRPAACSRTCHRDGGVVRGGSALGSAAG